MDAESIVGQNLPAIKPIHRPHPPSWIDRLNLWVNRLPAPDWVFYLLLWLLLILVESASKWLDGIDPYLAVRWIYVFYVFYGVFFLAAIHYLDLWAMAAFQTIKPVLAVGESEQSLMGYQLTTMPARTVWLLSAATLAGIPIFLRPLIIPLWEAMGFLHSSIGSTLVDLVLFSFNAVVVVVFVYHTLRQLSWISRIHKTATRINLFQLRPLYSLSWFTARTAGVLLLIGFVIEQQTMSHGAFTTDPYALRMSWLFTLGSVVVYSLLAAAVFFLPLLGLHQLLLKEKERLQAEADSRLQAQIQELHRRIDARQLENADAIQNQMASLGLERDILAKLPTWPWQPGTLNLILTAVLLPVLLWILQQLLERWAGL